MLRRLLRLSAVLSVMLVALIALVYLDYQRFLKTPLKLMTPRVFIVEAGLPFVEINRRLKAQHLITQSRYFEALARFSGQARQIKTGEYEIRPGLTPVELLDLLVSGQVIQYAFTLVEGWNLHTMLRAIRQSPLISNTLGDDPLPALRAALRYTETTAEGLFFPDTYYLAKGATDTDLLQWAYDRLQTVLAEEWQNRAAGLPYRSPYEALIMASIIEKETALASERGQIAGVFVRRLKKNMKLQTDPTVIYALGQGFDGNLRRKDLALDSAWNTYRYKGLPPGPIALAGREAIHAALNPAPGKTLYFVAKGDGSHYFSETLSEHNRAVARYQLKKQ